MSLIEFIAGCIGIPMIAFGLVLAPLLLIAMVLSPLMPFLELFCALNDKRIRKG